MSSVSHVAMIQCLDWPAPVMWCSACSFLPVRCSAYYACLMYALEGKQGAYGG